MLTYILFVAGFVILIKGADILVSGSASVAKRFNVSDLVVGLTIVSFGTSAPELIVNIIASINGSADIAIGNVFGSNIANILLILGVSALICNLPIQRNTVLSEIPFSLSAALLVGFIANASLFNEGEYLTISRYDGVILLGFFLLFMAYIFKVSKENNRKGNNSKIKELPLGKSVVFIVFGIVGMFLGGKWVVEGGVEIARLFGLSESFIGLTIVAVGTSLPELVTSAMAAYRRNADIAIGNVVGSNIFNLLWVLGVSAVINPLPFDVLSNTDILMVVFSSALLIIVMPFGKKNVIERWNGIVFLLIYAGYIGFLVQRG
ncbi:MAG: calcium/sodium antiporter [Bacteroidota bacterium]